jgi:hypothetical protein
MKTFITAAVAATLFSATGAIAQSWTLNESTDNDSPSVQTAPVQPVAPGQLAGRFYDPVENEFVTPEAIGPSGSQAGNTQLARFYDPVENEFVTVEPATGAIR